MSCFFVLYSPAQSIEQTFLVSGVHRLVCHHPDQNNGFLIASKQSCIGTLSRTPSEGTPQSLHVWRSAQDLLADDIIPESSCVFQRDFWCWTCHLFNCIQSLRLSCSRRAFRVVAISLGGYVSNKVVCTLEFTKCLCQVSFQCLSK